MLVEAFVNTFFIGEVLSKYKIFHHMVSMVVFIPLFLLRLIGGPHDHFLIYSFVIIGTIIFLIDIKLLQNLDQTNILSVIKSHMNLITHNAGLRDFQ